jgi:hypothetical protein
MAGPDFMVVGTQKAGTTWLFECLNEHPGVFVPELKEVHYFCPPEGWRVSRAAKGEAWYRDLYAKAPKGSVCGDMTTDYMYLPGVAEALHRFNPDSRLSSCCATRSSAPIRNTGCGGGKRRAWRISRVISTPSAT